MSHKTFYLQVIALTKEAMIPRTSGGSDTKPDEEKSFVASWLDLSVTLSAIVDLSKGLS